MAMEARDDARDDISGGRRGRLERDVDPRDQRRNVRVLRDVSVCALGYSRRSATDLLDERLLLEVARLEEVAGAHEQAVGLRAGDNEPLEDDAGDDLAAAELGRVEAVD